MRLVHSIDGMLKLGVVWQSPHTNNWNAPSAIGRLMSTRVPLKIALKINTLANILSVFQSRIVTTQSLLIIEFLCGSDDGFTG